MCRGSGARRGNSILHRATPSAPVQRSVPLPRRPQLHQRLHIPITLADVSKLFKDTRKSDKVVTFVAPR